MTNLPLFEQSRKTELSSYGEAVRISNELRYSPSGNKINSDGELFFDKGRLWRFDSETADYSKFTAWLNDSTIKKSQSLFWFVIRIMAIRFPEKHSEIRINLAENHKLEFDLILSQMKNDMAWVGTVGYSNMVRLDDSLLNLNNRVVKLKNDGYKIVRK